MEATGGHPADTIEAARRLHLILQAEGATTATLTHCRLATYETEAALRSVFDQIWDALGSASHARLVARRIATGEPRFGGGIRSPYIVRGQKALLDKSIVERSGRDWRFIEPLFARYIRGVDAS